MTENKSAPCHAYQRCTSIVFLISFLQPVKNVRFDKIRVKYLFICVGKKIGGIICFVYGRSAGIISIVFVH
jgi:hypothetical protein